VYLRHDYSCTDVFALGMVAFVLFTGRHPFAERRPEEIPYLVQCGARPDVKRLPVPYQALVSHCWEQGMHVDLPPRMH
jgi:hypothetical protein